MPAAMPAAMPDVAIFDRRADAAAAFLGRCAGVDGGISPALELLGRMLPDAPRRGVENRQLHSARCVEAEVGERHEADALWTLERDLALIVYTADCVPVLLAGPTVVAAAHAGWRGLASGVLPATIAALADPAGSLTAWIGPAIGACCYQVSEEVAFAVAATSSSRARVELVPRPHLDLAGAAAAQLEACGVRDLRLFTDCTGCQPDRLWSYRRHGATGRRNHALVWRLRD